MNNKTQSIPYKTKERQGMNKGQNKGMNRGDIREIQGRKQYREKTREKIIEKERVCTFVIHSLCITFLLYTVSNPCYT